MKIPKGKMCIRDSPYTAFSDLFHTVRSMMLPILYTIQEEVPEADLYHAIATGYSGVLARLGSYVNHVPYMITEHGIYTREREEEIIRAKWVVPAFKRFWVRFFYMLSDCAYSGASMITSLFDRAMEIQMCIRDRDEAGNIYLLLVQMNKRNFGIVGERLDSKGLQYQLVEKVG